MVHRYIHIISEFFEHSLDSVFWEAHVHQLLHLSCIWLHPLSPVTSSIPLKHLGVENRATPAAATSMPATSIETLIFSKHLNHAQNVMMACSKYPAS